MKKAIIFLLVIFIFFLMGKNIFVYSQENLPLVISPTKHEVELSPGEKKTIELGLFNKGNLPISGVFKIADFIVLDDKGTPTLIEKNPNLNQSGKDWVTILTPQAVIDSHKEYKTSVLIQAPLDAVPGGHYVALYFQPSIDAQEGRSNISVRIVSLVNIKITGEIRENLLISSLKIASFLENPPVNTDFILINSGNYHIAPKGSIVLKNMFGNKVDEVTMTKRNIFPGAGMQYKISLGKGFLLGPYSVGLSLNYGQQTKTLRKEQYVFVFPWRIFLILIVGLTILYYMSKALRGKSSDQKEDLLTKRRISLLKERVKKRYD